MQELWVNSIIDREWLEWFSDSWRIYQKMLHDRIIYQRKLNTLKSVDYSSDKVINGASRHVSEEERYTMRLERINADILEVEKTILPAKQRLIKQVCRLKKHQWRQVLILFYIDRRKLTDIVQYLFEVEPDYEEKKDSTYLDAVKRWKREAIQHLEELSQKPFIPVVEKQLNLIGVNNDTLET